MTSRIGVALLLFVLAAAATRADTGVIIPSSSQQPDPAVLSLAEMSVLIRIDGGDARVLICEIFINHTARVLEGDYVFSLPDQALISDFAVWDDVVRIPGAILERKRAGEVYAEARNLAIDPGLLQMGERTAEEASRGAPFSARIVPIPAYGTKRIEIEYHQRLPVEDLTSSFSLPLRPSAYAIQRAHRMSLSFELDSAHDLEGFETVSKTYPLQVSENGAHRVRASFESSDVAMSEDFTIRYRLGGGSAGSLQVLTHRDSTLALQSPAGAALLARGLEPGFFEASALLPPAAASQAPGAVGPQAAPRTVVLLFDTSLSMQWEKLDRSFQALETTLHSLRPTDRFNLVLFNTELSRFAAAPVLAEPAQVEKALAFVKSSSLRGGTDLQQALKTALDTFAPGELARASGENDLLLFSDLQATRGTIGNAKLASWYETERNKLPAGTRPRTYLFAVGDDVNQPLLKLLAHEDALATSVRSTEPLDFKLNAFVSKIGRQPVQGLSLTLEPAADFDLVYALDEAPFAGSMANWVGQYHNAASRATFTVRGRDGGRALDMRVTTPLPPAESGHDEVPRLWAKARVDALLAKIERDGEDQATVDEIIRLSRQYKFVTPYTSFLAAPRALLRPRVIRPGDPVLRVKTDPSIVSVTALFAFGLIKPLRYLKGEDTWQARFLIPPDLKDGAYQVRLLLRDGDGHLYREQKSFVVLSQTPVVRVNLDGNRFRRGQAIKLRVGASQWTRTVVARFPGTGPVELHWDPRAGASTGEIVLPDDLPPGVYKLTVTAEDVAHNVGSQEVALEVTP